MTVRRIEFGNGPANTPLWQLNMDARVKWKRKILKPENGTISRGGAPQLDLATNPTKK